MFGMVTNTCMGGVRVQAGELGSNLRTYRP